MTPLATVLTVLAVLGLAIGLLALRLFKPVRHEQQAIDAVRELAQQELRDWTRRHSKSGESRS